MELDLLITELDETTIQIDKMRYLTTQISTKAGEKTKHAKNALQYDFESQEIVKCAAILSDYIEAADAAIKKAVSALAVYDTELQARDIKESPAEVVVDDVVE